MEGERDEGRERWRKRELEMEGDRDIGRERERWREDERLREQ